MNDKQAFLGETDENLLRLFTNSQEKAALEVLFDRHMASAYHLAYKYMHNQADAEDVVQKAFIKIMRFSADQNQPEMVKAWIMKTVINTSKNEIRDLIRHRRRILAKPFQETTAGPELAEDANELRKILVTAIEQLPEHFRLPIWLTHYENMSIKEVSDCLGKPEKTIRTQISRGLEKLEIALKGRGSYINGINIIALLAECKSIDKVPKTLYEKIKAISIMKHSSKIATQTISKTPLLSSMTISALSFLLLGTIGYFWWQNEKKTDIAIKNIQEKNITMAENNIDELNLSCDFSSNEIPAWCYVESGKTKLFNDLDEHGQYLKIEGTEDFILKLKIPQQKKAYKVSYDFNPKGFTSSKYSMQLLPEIDFGLVAFKFTELFSHDDIWNHIEIITQKNVQSIWINGSLAALSIISIDYKDPVSIQLGGVIGRLDNIKIKRVNESDLLDYSKCIELAKFYRTSGKSEDTLPSPIPNIKQGEVKIKVIRKD